MYLKQPGFTCSSCGPFTKHCERIQKFRETGNLKHLCRNELDKAYFAHEAAYSESKDLSQRTISDKVLKDRAYEIGRNPGYQMIVDIKGYQSALVSMVYKFFDEKTGSGVRATSKAGLSVNEQLAEELHKPVTKKFKRRKVVRDLKIIFGQQI